MPHEKANLLRKVNRFFEKIEKIFAEIRVNKRSTKRAKRREFFRPRGIRLYVIRRLIHGTIR